MKLLVDMNLSPQWIHLLVSAGHDAIHWSSVGAANAPDTEIMRRALADERIVFTHDLDFTGILAATGAQGPSVAQLREQDIDPSRVSAAVLAALTQFADGLKEGAIVSVDLRRARARVLPLSREG
jgi:predicted nuclease of predicted toxin-antitoxin system